MNSAELANFKNKLAIKLDTTTNEEAQLVSSMVDNASGGGGGAGVAGYILHPVEHEFEGRIYAKLSPDEEPVGLPGMLYTSEGLTDTSIFASNINAYVLMIYDENKNMNVYVDEYTGALTEYIDPATISSADYYVDSDVCILSVVVGENMYLIIPSLDVIHPGTGAPK